MFSELVEDLVCMNIFIVVGIIRGGDCPGGFDEKGGVIAERSESVGRRKCGCCPNDTARFHTVAVWAGNGAAANDRLRDGYPE